MIQKISARIASILFAALLFLCFSITRAHADEVEWNNTDATKDWNGSGQNWWINSASTTTPFAANNSALFGANDAPNTTSIANGGRITISASNGVIIAASGTNPGMIVTGTANWEFACAFTATGTAATIPGIGISGSGGLLMQGTGTLTLSTTTAYVGATQVAAGTLRLNVANAIAQSSGVTLASAATLDLAGYNQILNALAVSSGANVFFSSTGANYATLTLGKLTGNGALFNMRVDLGSVQGDKIVITGTSEGAHTLNFINSSSAAPAANTTLLVVSTTPQSTATFSGTTEAGAYAFGVEKGANGSWYLANGTALSRTAAAVVATAAVTGQDWHYQLDALYKRMGDLRQPPTEYRGNLWLRASASRLNADDTLTGYGFHQYNYGITLGADKAFRTTNATWYLGAFGDLNRVDRSFNTGGDGTTNTAGGGLYATWLYCTGWYADITGRFDHNQNNLTATSIDGYAASGKYNANTKGFSVEFGRRLFVNDDWWVEPGIQYAYANIDGADYTTTAPALASTMNVSIASAQASQTRVMLRFGQDDGEALGWHPYATIAVVYSSTSDGRVIVDNSNPLKTDFDGWRFECGIGAAYSISRRSQVYYDYEYAKATRYSRPWSLNLGYRLMW